jgi:spore coat protein X
VSHRHDSKDDHDKHHHRKHHRHHHKFSALDPFACKDPATVAQAAAEQIRTVQSTEDEVVIKDSCNVTVTTVDVQAAINLQVAIQLAIALVLSVSIADGDAAKEIQQDLMQKISTRQAIKQKTYVKNSRDIKVSMADAEASVNIQVLLQVLLALVAKLEIL